MQKQDFEGERPDCFTNACSQINHVTVWDLAKEFHVGRNTVANIVKELSIQFKYENCSGKIRAFVYDDEADRIRQVLDERYNNHVGYRDKD